jgi:hypothetical protein
MKNIYIKAEIHIHVVLHYNMLSELKTNSYINMDVSI